MKHAQLQQWICNIKPDDFKANHAVRISIMPDLRVRVRVELMEKLGEPAPETGELFIGPFKSVAEAETEGRNISKIVRQAIGMEKQ